MPIEYRPINCNDKLDTEIVERLLHFIEKSWEQLNFEPGECPSIGGYIIVKSAIEEGRTIVGIRNIRLKTNKYDFDIATHLREKIEHAAKTFKLKTKEVEKIVEEMKQEYFQFLGAEKQVEFINKLAQELSNEKYLQDIMEDFEKRYSSFSDGLNSDLQKLYPEMKENVKTMLTNITTVIARVKNSL